MDARIGELQQELEAAHIQFVDIAGRLDPAKRDAAGVCGEWSPREVAAHLVGWDASVKQLIDDIENFEPPYDVHGFNQRSVAARADRAWRTVMSELSTNFTELTQALATVTPDMRIYDHVTGWLGGRLEDYRLHTGQLEAWVEEGRNE